MKSKAKTTKTVIFQENQGKLFQFYPGRIEEPFLSSLFQITVPFN